ncbi:S41 family peptidase [Candidatus Solincola tengchongensis]|uniref:S41 family peptidase n=1 Tax=Candidatus Solincola tengchongensis TaxID=2900693 RepID=UPI0025804338|nr:S41 family peptidase [Candidatus Solincola tengchongensis]
MQPGPDLADEGQKRRDRRIAVLAVVLSLLLVGSCFAVPYLLTSSGRRSGGTSSGSQGRGTAESSDELRKLLLDSDSFRRAEDIVEGNYVEEVDEEELLEAAARGIRRLAESGADRERLVARGVESMLDSLDDPFTAFMNAEQLEMLDTQLSGHFSGIGVAMQKVKNQIRVVQVLEGTPAQEVGIREGDIVLEVDDRDVTHMELDEVVMLIRGPEGTTVRIGVSRPGEPDILRFDIMRRRIEIPVMETEVKEGGVGYIRLTDWTQDAAERLREALADLGAKGVSSLVIDLRSNPGGYMEPAIEAADLFLRDGVIVSSRGRVAGVSRVYEADGEVSWDLPVYVLVNRGSASASEIFAAALRENNRCLLVGEATFGKGSIQQIFRQPDGTGIRLTIARYYTPRGNNIDDQGIAPDFPVRNPLVGGEDLQLQRALEAARGTR